MQSDDPGADDEISGPEQTTVRWFGGIRPAFLDERTRVETPVGEPCLAGCGEAISPHDIGMTIPEASTGQRHPYHRDCFLRMLGVDPATRVTS